MVSVSHQGFRFVDRSQSSAGSLTYTQRQLNTEQQELSPGNENGLGTLEFRPRVLRYPCQCQFNQQDPRHHVPYRGEVVSLK
jgi:hypothetical protein